MKVLLADDDAERAGALERSVRADSYQLSSRLKPHESLTDGFASLAPDVVPGDMTRRDRDALDGIRQVAALDTGPVLPFVDQDEPAFVEDAIGAQVSFYNAMGLRPPDVQPVLCAAVALFRRHQQMQEDLKQAESRLNESAVVDRAKVTPIKQRWLSEPDTCRWLPRALMSSARRTVDVATELIKALEGNAG